MELIKKKLKQIIVSELGLVDVAAEDIGDNEPLFGDTFGLDSIDAVELVFQVKKHFKVEIRDMKEGRPALQSINTLAQFIQDRLVS
jgi:acyl carrier protein